MRDIKMQQFAHGLVYLLYTWIAKFQNFFTLHANKMVVLFKPKSLFVLCQIFAKLVATN